MPTPVSSARQCLTEKSAAALDEAVAVARRRGHNQTTSLHMVSSLISLPNSSLREACTRTRNAFSTRVQFKALELSLSVSLDRFPSTNKVEEPPISNSLMAAIKRSQANQRRQPENFNFYQQQQYSSTVPVVKVELQNLILSILDDPLVSRVFSDAGFRSCDVKMATIKPNSFHPTHLFGCTSRYKRSFPPLFLSNLDNYSSSESKGFSFPFTGCVSGDENSRKTCEIMLRSKKRNPVLLGFSANDVLGSFLEAVERKIEGFMSVGLRNVNVVCVGDEILRFLDGDCDKGILELRFKEVESLLENVKTNGVLISLGDIKGFCRDSVAIDSLRYLIGRLNKLLEVHGRKMWLIGVAATYEVYFKFLNKFPSVEVDWDLEILPITSLRSSMGGSYPRSSLMESFVPLGGFFSIPSDGKVLWGTNGQDLGRCNSCNSKCQQEIGAHSNGGISASIAQQCHSSLPSWLHISDTRPKHDLSSMKFKDDNFLLNAKIAGLQRKWNVICKQHHQTQAFMEGATCQSSYQYPQVMGFQVSENRKSETSNTRHHSGASSIDLQPSSPLKGTSLDMLSKANKLSLLSKSNESPSEFSNDPKSPASVTTDLGLGIINVSATKIQEKAVNQSGVVRIHSNVKDPKLLYKALVKRVSWQEEAINTIVRAITDRGLHAINRSDTWINLRGPDILGKRKLGIALAEILYGSIESLIYVNLSFQDDVTDMHGLFNSGMKNKYELRMRGTVVDYLVEKLSKGPSVVFFENIDKADLVVQNNLIQAVKSGRLMDLNGREVNIMDSVFLATTKLSDDFEEDVSRTKGNLIQILIRYDLNDHSRSQDNSSDMNLMINKRKLFGRSTNTRQNGCLEVRKRAHKASNFFLDLNSPAGESDVTKESDSNYSENLLPWMENFEGKIDGTVAFKPYDFDKAGEKLYKEISKCLCGIVGFECSLEVEPSVMQQLLAATYLFDEKRVVDWIWHVLSEGFVAASKNFSVDDHSIVKLVKFEDLEDGQVNLLPERILLS